MSSSSLKIMKESPITEYSDLDVATNVSYSVASSSGRSSYIHCSQMNITIVRGLNRRRQASLHLFSPKGKPLDSRMVGCTCTVTRCAHYD
jgi:hypothetical protein